MGYRDASEALRDRVVDLQTRLARIDEDSETALRGLPASVTEHLAALRAGADLPAGEPVRVADLGAAERAAEDYERGLDEALGLHAQLGKSVGGLLPERRTVTRWASFAAAALLGSTLAVYELGLTNFMLRACGAEVAIAHAQLTSGLPLGDVDEAPAPAEATDEAFFQLIVESRPPLPSTPMAPEGPAARR